MKIYEVTGSFITFDIGIELKLSETQVESRLHSLWNMRKNIFAVTKPVQFKRGEKLGIYEAFLTKSLLENLKEIMDEKSENKGEESDEYPRIQHASFGKYNVFDADKNLLTKKPVKKGEAEKILSEILAQNQINNDSSNDENNEKDDAGNLASNQNV